ncbi:MAG: ankyrin repeat domain-containing protein [Treponema sp.]|nr:ankyrin repeat domain-containing protein [Treponema sp.]
MTDDGRDLFKNAVAAGNLDVVKLLLKDFESFDEEDRIFVLIASILNSDGRGTEILDYVVSTCGYGMDFATDDGWTVLHYAAATSDPNLVKYFVDRGADIEARTKFEATPLLVAGSNTPNPEVIDMLLKCGADIDARDNENESLLIEAAKNKNPSIMEYVLTKGFDLEERDVDGWTAIMNAARWNENSDVLVVLRKAGADSNVKTTSGGTLLHLAALNESEDMAQYLCAFFSVNDPDEKGVTPFQLASMSNPNPNVLEIMMDAQKEETFFNVCCNPNPNVIVKILGSGFAPNFETSDMSRPIFWVAKNNENPEVLAALLASGAIAEVTDLLGRNFTHYAAANENSAIYDWIVSHEEFKVLIDAEDSEGHDSGYYRNHPDEF